MQRVSHATGEIKIILVIIAIFGALMTFNGQLTTPQSHEATVTATTWIAPTDDILARVQATSQYGASLTESQRLARLATDILDNPGGNAETAALLSSRALKIAYSPQADAALQQAMDRLDSSRKLVGHTDFVNSVAFSPDGKLALTGSEDGTARLWDVNTGQSVRIFKGHTYAVRSVAFSPDSKLALTGSNDETARLWDANTGQSVRIFSEHVDIRSTPKCCQHYNLINSVAFSPDGKLALVGANDVRLWDVNTGQTLRIFTVPYPYVIDSVAFSPDGKLALTGGWDNTARLWDVNTGQILHAFTGHTDLIDSVAFSPDGKLALTGSYDHTARLWDVNTGQILRIFTGHTFVVSSVAFSPDGKLALTENYDHTARLWDVNTGQTLRTFIGVTEVITVAFSPDGKLALTGNEDHTARLWDVDYRDFINFACNHMSHDFTNDQRAEYGILDFEPTCPQFANAVIGYIGYIPSAKLLTSVLNGRLMTPMPPTTTPLAVTLPSWTLIPSPTPTPPLQ